LPKHLYFLHPFFVSVDVQVLLLDLLEPVLLLLASEVIRPVLLDDRLLERASPDLNLPVPDKRAAVGLLRLKVRGIQMELAVEVGHAVHCARVLALALLVPLDAQPDVAARLGVVNQLACVADASKESAKENSLTQKMRVFRVGLNWAACFRLFNHYYCVIK
jgi:hypothetical protein